MCACTPWIKTPFCGKPGCRAPLFPAMAAADQLRDLRALQVARISQHVEAILRELGQDPEREGLRETPKRYAKALVEICTPEPFTCTSFINEAADAGMVIQTGISFTSLCEHHILPFFGKAAVAYIPGNRIVGLSKLVRIVRQHAAGLQNQERITSAIVTNLEQELAPHGVAVMLKARHLCMEMRGVKAHGAESTTTCLTGLFKTDDKARSEFMAALGAHA